MTRVCVLLAVLGLLVVSAEAAVQTTIYKIQTGLHTVNTIVSVGTQTSVVVTASGRFGFCIQEVVGQAPGPYPDMYCGIWVFTNGSHVGLLKRGDKVVVTGKYAEYFNLSEINTTTAGSEGGYQVVGTATERPPVYLHITDIRTGGALAENFESVIVKIDVGDTSLFARQPDSYSEWYLSTSPTIGQGDSILIDSFSADPSPAGDFDYTLPELGDELTYVQGMLTYDYSNFKISPRNCPEDMGMGCPPGVRGAWAVNSTQVDLLFAVAVDLASAQTAGNYYFESPLSVLTATRDALNHRVVHLQTTAQTTGTSDILYVENVLSEDDLVPVPPNYAQASFTQGVLSLYAIQHVSNVLADASPYRYKIVTTSGRVAAVDGNVYYLQEGDAGPFKHLQARIAPYGPLAAGDSVKLAGVVDEYSNSTYVGFKSGVQYWENLGPATDAVITTSLNANQMIYDAYPVTGQPWRPGNNLPEPWEDALVHLIQPATVDSVDGSAALYGEYWLLAGTDSCMTDIDHSLNDYGATLSPRGLWVGDIIDMTGILRYEFTFYRIVPRQQSDIVILHSNMGIEDPVGSLVRMTQNRPNPFAGGTSFSFRLEANANAVSAEVYDVTGACVRHLLHGAPARSGEHVVAWDGMNDRGLPMPAGTYFYRLTVDGRSEARQMIRID